MFVPIKKKKKSEDGSLLANAVSAFNKLVDKDPTKMMMEFMKEENDKSRAHEERMFNMQLEMMKVMTNGYSLGPQNMPRFEGHMEPYHENQHFFMNQLNASPCPSPVPGPVPGPAPARFEERLPQDKQLRDKATGETFFKL